MLLSILSTDFSSSVFIIGADFLIVFTSWSLCLPEYRLFYHELRTLDKYIHTCSQSRSKECPIQGATHIVFCLLFRSAIVNLNDWLEGHYSYNL